MHSTLVAAGSLSKAGQLHKSKVFIQESNREPLSVSFQDLLNLSVSLFSPRFDKHWGLIDWVPLAVGTSICEIIKFSVLEYKFISGAKMMLNLFFTCNFCVIVDTALKFVLLYDLPKLIPHYNH